MRHTRAPSHIIVIAAFLTLTLVLPCCAPRWKSVPPYQTQQKQAVQHQPQAAAVRKMGYTVQVGAFSKVENASRLTKRLEAQGLDAFYYTHTTGMYRVRFGNYTTPSKAREVAERLGKLGIIDAFYVVNPGEYAVARTGLLPFGTTSLRGEIVNTAQTYIGLPYEWGSCTINGPNDCSGLVMAVYQLNGLSVPRTSQDQHRNGIPVRKNDLGQGDLVFFSTNKSGRVNHVGIYIGGDLFIHAPSTGKTICTDSLTSAYFSERYVGACTYLR